jgi:Heterokaryon incompatibility protein (HET)
MMNRIYGRAEEVSVWLGEEREDSKNAIKLINNLVELDIFDTIADMERSTDWSMARDLEAFIKLLKRGWFSRRWVVQVGICCCLWAHLQD